VSLPSHTAMPWIEDYWQRKRLSLEDFQRINEIPCARKSLITGLVSGAGIGMVRGLSAGVLATEFCTRRVMIFPSRY
jgi:hypothetical protein